MAAAVFYLNDPAAPKPNRPAHLGVNILLEWDGKLLLERRRDCGMPSPPQSMQAKSLPAPRQAISRKR